MSWHDGPLLGIDTETTAADPLVAVPVSYALVLRRDGTRMSIDQAIIDPECEIPEEATAIHGISTERARAEGIPLMEAMVRVKEKLLKAQAQGVPVVGQNVSYDLTIVHRYVDLSEFTGTVLDILVLDKQLHRYRKGSRRLAALAAHYGAEAPSEIGAEHDAAADAVLALLTLDGMVRKWPWLAYKPIEKLHRYQEKAWADQQRSSLSEYFVEQGKEPIPWEDYGWPIKRGALAALEEEGADGADDVRQDVGRAREGAGTTDRGVGRERAADPGAGHLSAR